MGHLGAGWLERPKREQEERTDLLVKNMKLSKTDHVADIGAGSGYFSFRISPLVPEGQVHAVDISPQMLGIIRAKKAKSGCKNVITVQSSIKSTTLAPNSIDCALMVDAYHEFSYPREMAISILFFARNGTRDNFFELFAKVFRRFRPRGNFFAGPIFFQILADSAAIRLVQKSSKSEPSSRFFGHLKFRKSLPVNVLPKFPRRIQNRNGHLNVLLNPTSHLGDRSCWIQLFTAPTMVMTISGTWMYFAV